MHWSRRNFGRSSQANLIFWRVGVLLGCWKIGDGDRGHVDSLGLRHICIMTWKKVTQKNGWNKPVSNDQSILVKKKFGMFCGHQSSPWTCRFKSVLDIFCQQGICHSQRFLPEFASHSPCRVLNKSDPRRCSQRGQTFRASLEAQTWEHTIVSNPFRPLKCNLSNREDLFFSLNWEVFVRQDFLFWMDTRLHGWMNTDHH